MTRNARGARPASAGARRSRWSVRSREASFAGKVVFVTGAGAGIGRAVAEAFAAEGADVAVTGLDEEALRETADRVEAGGRRAQVVLSDVCSGEQIAAESPPLPRRWGARQAVNNAGVEQPSGVRFLLCQAAA